MEPSIAIIGGGLAGLSAGCYGRMNGYRTTIFEMHDLPGGVCTGWKRKGYTIDGAVNWVMGTKRGTMFHRFWQELGVAREWEIYNHDRFMTVENGEGDSLTLYSDAERLEEQLLEIAPEDREVIRQFTGAIRQAARLSMPTEKPEELYGLLDMVKMVKMIPVVRFMKRWSKVTVGEFVGHYQNPRLRELFLLAFPPEGSMVMVNMVLGWQHAQTAGYIIGGALPLAAALERRYRELGGEIRYRSRVDEILVEGNRAVGVRLSDGSEQRAEWVISAADGRTTIFDMLGGRFTDAKIRERYENPNLFAPLVYISIGINRKLNELPPSLGGLLFPLKEPIIVAGKEEKSICVRSYTFDPTLTSEGKELLVVQFDSDYDQWRRLYDERERYKAEKERIAREVIDRLEKRFGGIADAVEMIDVATPVTWERYTGNWRGAYEGWMMDEESFTGSMEKALPGLDRFYMAGQWVNPGGGIPTAVMSGNHTVQLICKRDRRKFVAAQPEQEKPRTLEAEGHAR